MTATTTTGHLSGVRELTDWLLAATNASGVRCELWRKLRSDAEPLKLESIPLPRVEPLSMMEAAERLLAFVDRDERGAAGHAAHAVYVYRADEEIPFRRAFVSARERHDAVLAAPSYGAPLVTPESYAMSSVFASMGKMTQEVFATLQQETEHQRKTNHELVRANVGHFDSFAKAYERTLTALQAQIDEAHKTIAALREEKQGLMGVIGELHEVLEERSKIDLRETADIKKEQQRHDFAFKTLNLLGPAVLAKVTNQPIVGASPAAEFLRNFLLSLERQQLERIEAVLSEEQRAAFALIMSEAAKGSATSSTPPDASATSHAPPREGAP